MTSKPVPDDELRLAHDAYERNDGNVSAAARELGLSRSTLRDRLLKPAPESPVTMPEFADDDIPIEDVINMQERRFKKRFAAVKEQTWFPIKIKSNEPIGVLWFGDPHVDDDGCNWPVLKVHIRICKETEGLYGANIGDTTNNWAGRLIKKYADQDASVKTARRMAEWFMLDSDVQWLIWLLGNHDTWGDGGDILARMGRRHGTRKVIMHDWEARFSLTFPNDWQPRIYAAHDFRGHSQWNPLHGPMKAGQMGASADLYVAGHKHNWGIMRFENADRDAIQTFVRVRGYKFLDDYARRLGIIEQQQGCSVLTIFDPSTRSILAFDDVEHGARYLAMLRAA